MGADRDRWCASSDASRCACAADEGHRKAGAGERANATGDRGGALASEAYRLVVENLPTLVVQYDRQLRRTWVNKAWQEASGLTASEVVGRPVNEGVRAPTPVNEAYVAVLAEVLADAQPRAVSFRWINARGVTLDLEYSVIPELDAAGAVVGLLAVGHDVTARNKLARDNAKLAVVVDASPVGIIVADCEGRIRYVNPAFLSTTRYAVDDVLGHHWNEFWLPTDPDPARGVISATLHAGQQWKGLVSCRRADGGRQSLRLTVAPLWESDGAYGGCVAIGEDMTDWHALEAEFRQAQKMEVVGRLTAGVVHDLNNLLTVILGGAHLSSELVRSPEGEEIVADIVAAGERAAWLARQLLGFSRQSSPQLQRVDLGALVARMGRLIRRLAPERVRVDVEVPPSPLALVTDERRIEQVVLNLAVNALDAMPSGGRLTLRASRHERCDEGARDGVFGEISVADTGVGMDDHTRERLFTPFFTTKPEGKGTGLGLSTVRSIVEEAGGFLSVESRLCEGSTFRVFLPLVEVAPAASIERSEQTLSGRGEAVLLVMEDAALRRTLTRVLREAGYRALAAATCEEAFACVLAFPGGVQLTIADATLTDGVASALVARLLDVCPTMRALVLGDGATRPDGVERVLEKPFDPSTLLGRVRDALREPTIAPSH